MPMLVRTAAVDSDAWMLTGATSVNADSAQEDENRCLIPPGNAGEFLGVHSYIPPFINCGGSVASAPVPAFRGKRL